MKIVIAIILTLLAITTVAYAGMRCTTDCWPDGTHCVMHCQ